jgi:hypothetical protein
MQERIRHALYGGTITGLIIGLPVLNLLNCFCCAGVLLGGLLTIFFHTRDTGPQGPPLSSSDAIQLGALSGVFGAVIGTVIQAILMVTLGNVAGDLLLSWLEEGGVLQSFPPESERAFRDMLAEQQELTLLNLVIMMVIWLVIGPLFGLLGGLIGHALFRPAMQIPPTAPQSSGSTTNPS